MDVPRFLDKVLNRPRTLISAVLTVISALSLQHMFQNGPPLEAPSYLALFVFYYLVVSIVFRLVAWRRAAVREEPPAPGASP